MGDGLFWMDLDAFVKNFSDTNVNQDTSSWFHDYFLKIDDDTNGTHYVTVTNNSGAPQEVFVGAHVWATRHYTLKNAQDTGACPQSGGSYTIGKKGGVDRGFGSW